MVQSKRFHISSMTTIMLVLVVTIVLEMAMTVSMFSGALSFHLPNFIPYTWLGLRVATILAVILFWILRQKSNLYRAILAATSLLTLGLVTSALRLILILINRDQMQGTTLLNNVVFIAVVNVLTFSIWYWVIDPPGIDESLPTDAPWEFLFPQRAGNIPGYENWIPRYTDYLALAFYTSFAFSPTDSAPLTRRAKALFIFQSTISIVTITFIAGSAINLLGQ